jgi:hypothetical protein
MEFPELQRKQWKDVYGCNLSILKEGMVVCLKELTFQHQLVYAEDDHRNFNLDRR